MQAGAIVAGIAPGNGHAVSGFDHTRQALNAADRFLIEINDLLRRFLVAHHGNVDGQDVLHIETRLCGLHGDERLQKHAGAGEQHEGSCDLHDGEYAEAAVGASCNADTAAGKVGSLRRVGGWEVGNVSKKN